MFCAAHNYNRDCWPIKVNADHNLCLSQEMALSILPLSRPAKGKELRLRSIIHDVPETEILGSLAEFGMSKDLLPVEIGGKIEFSIAEWLANRREGELADNLGSLDKELEELLNEVDESAVTLTK
jgi:hypothetical protein